MSPFLVVVTFIVARNLIFLNTTGLIEPPSQPTDAIEVLSFGVGSLAEAKTRAAEAMPPSPVAAGWRHGPVVVVELATGKITRLEIRKRMRTITKEVTEQDGFEAIEVSR